MSVHVDTNNTRFYQDKYGEVYEFLDVAENINKFGIEYACFRRVYPFENKTFTINLQDFYSAYKLMTQEEVTFSFNKQREEFQNEIIEKKNQEERIKKEELLKFDNRPRYF